MCVFTDTSGCIEYECEDVGLAWRAVVEAVLVLCSMRLALVVWFCLYLDRVVSSRGCATYGGTIRPGSGWVSFSIASFRVSGA